MKGEKSFIFPSRNFRITLATAVRATFYFNGSTEGTKTTGDDDVIDESPVQIKMK